MNSSEDISKLKYSIDDANRRILALRKQGFTVNIVVDVSGDNNGRITVSASKTHIESHEI